MSTVSELLDEIKKKCPEQNLEINKLILNIDKNILSKKIVKKKMNYLNLKR